MIITTRHGVFLVTNTKETIAEDDSYLYAEWPDFFIEIRSPSIRDLMGLMDSFPEQCGYGTIEEDPCPDMPSFKFKIEIGPEDWVGLMARIGAGITYKSFIGELNEVYEDGLVDSGVLTLAANLKVIIMQIYSDMSGSFNHKTIH